MKRTLLIAAAAMVASFVLTTPGWAFGTKDVIQMYRDGIPDSLIIQKIEYSGKIFRLDASDMRNLKRANVPDGIISAMLATEDQPDGYGPYYRPYYRPYSGPYYPSYPYYSPYYYPRVVVGFGFHGYHTPYFGHYGHGFHNYYRHGAFGGFAHRGHGMRRFR